MNVSAATPTSPLPSPPATRAEREKRRGEKACALSLLRRPLQNLGRRHAAAIAFEQVERIVMAFLGLRGAAVGDADRIEAAVGRVAHGVIDALVGQEAGDDN